MSATSVRHGDRQDGRRRLHQHLREARRATTTGSACPSPASRTAATRSALSARVAGSLPRARRRLQRRLRRAQHTAHGRARSRDRLQQGRRHRLQHAPRPATRPTPRTNGAIQIRLNRTGVCTDAPPPSLRRARLHARRAARGDGHRHDRPDGGVHAARPDVHGVRPGRRPQEALQRGRQAMELITRQLRSQVCVGTTNADRLRDRHERHLLRRPERRHDADQASARSRYSAVTDTITETLVTGAGTYPNLTFTGTPVQHAAAHQGQADPGQRSPGNAAADLPLLRLQARHHRRRRSSS